MIDVRELLIELRSQGIQLWVQDETLKFRAPHGVLQPSHRGAIQARRPEILEFLAKAGARSDAVSPEPIAHVRAGPMPLSFAQQRLLFIDQLDPAAGVAYHMAAGLRIHGDLDRSALQATLDRVVARHEALRTMFISQGDQPLQVIQPAGIGFQLPDHDLRHLGEIAQQRAIDEISQAEFAASFDLAKGPLFRGRLLRLSDQRHILLFTQHHIISDGWSVGILIREISALYTAFKEGRADPLPALPLQYADYAAWQRSWLTPRLLERQAKYWCETLRGAPALCELPTDHPRTSRRDFSGGWVPCVLDAQLTQRLRSFSQRHGVTLFVTLLASWSALVARLSGQDDVVIGIPTANRTRREFEGLIGFFVNTLALRLDLSGAPSVQELLRRVKKSSLAAQSHQDIPFEQVVEALRPVRSLAYTPVFQVFFAWEQGSGNAITLPGLTLAPFVPEYQASAKFDLTLALADAGDRIEGSIDYAASLFECASVLRFLSQWRRMLEEMLNDDRRSIDQLSILPVAESELLDAWNAKDARCATDLCIHELFEAQAAMHPTAIAVSFGGETITYAELNARANQRARHLRRLGVRPDDRVAICVERSLEMVISTLATLKAGGAYVPLDPSYPIARLARMVCDSAPAVVISHSGADDCLADPSLAAERRPQVVDCRAEPAAWAAESAENLSLAAVGLTAGHLAYVIYTSGSTAASKGVCVEHSQIAAMGAAWQELYRLRPGMSHLQMASFSFDVFTGDFVRALCYGGRLILCPRDALLDGEELYRLINLHRVTMGEFVPVVLRAFVTFLEEHGRNLGAMETVVCGSDVWSVEDARRLRNVCGTAPRTVNTYGLTEASVDSTYFEQEDRGYDGLSFIPIGRPLANARVYLLDRHLQRVPIGVVGELYIGGDGVARGYLNHPQLTAARFLADPFAKPAGAARMYRTGDLGRWHADGNVEFLGRNDFQVKIRGFRIELGEIDARLLEFPGVRDAVAAAREDTPGDRRIVAYYVADGAVQADALRRQLKTQLPEYMLPAAFMRLDSMPMTPNGKLDRRALPAPDDSSYARSEYEEPQGKTEQLLAGIWSELLKLERVGRHDNFFESGGHSLLGMQLTNRIRADFRIELALRKLFEEPTVAALAVTIDAARAAGSTQQLPPLTKRHAADVIPLSFAQERLWFLRQLEGINARFNIPIALRMRGTLSCAALEASLQDVVQRHESLRTVFAADGESSRQTVLSAESGRMEILRVDSSDEEIAQMLAAAAARPFDLTREIPIRAVLFRLDDAQHVLLLVNHHIASDAWSLAPLTRDFIHAYRQRLRGIAPDWPPLPVQYGDYAIWERRVFGKTTEPDSLIARQALYWRKTLDGLPAQVILPTDRPRPAVASSRGDAVIFHIPPEHHRNLLAVARQSRSTLFMLLHASVAALLTRLGAGNDISIGTAVARRPSRVLDDLVGLFVNLLVLRTRTADNLSLSELLTHVRDVDLAAYEHQDIPFEQIVDIVNPRRSRTHHPLFQVSVVLLNTEHAVPELPGLTLALEDIPNPIALFDLALQFAEKADARGNPLGIEARIGFACDLYDRTTIEAFAIRLRRVLDAAIADMSQPIGRIDILTDQERSRNPRRRGTAANGAA